MKEKRKKKKKMKKQKKKKIGLTTIMTIKKAASWFYENLKKYIYNFPIFYMYDVTRFFRSIDISFMLLI